MSNSGFVAMITGCNGISKATAFELLNLGYDKFVMGYRNNQQNAIEVKQKLEEKNAKVILIQGDLADFKDMDRTLEAYFTAIKEHFNNKLTALIHSAGCHLPVTGNESDGYYSMYPRFFQKAVERALPLMEDGQGRIIAVSSPGCNLSQHPRPNYPAGPAKAALEHLVRNYALKLAPRRITVNCIIPGIVNTTAWGVPEASIQRIADLTPMKIVLQPEHIAAPIGWLCSPLGISITGVLLPVDCGCHFSDYDIDLSDLTQFLK